MRYGRSVIMIFHYIHAVWTGIINYTDRVSKSDAASFIQGFKERENCPDGKMI